MGLDIANQIAPEWLFQITAVVVTVGVTLSTLEFLAARRVFAKGGLLSWDVWCLQGIWSIRGKSAVLAHLLLGHQGFIAVLAVRIAATVLATALLCKGEWAPALWLISVLTSLCVNFRSAFGLDGSFHATLIVLSAILIASCFPSSGMISTLCLCFIGIQGLLSYLVAGYWKIVSRTWRDGSAIVGIFSTSIYGNQWVHRMLARSLTLRLVVSWSVILFETALPILAFFSPTTTLLFLSIGLLFHLSAAFLMGLNGFLWSFVAMYPGIFFTIETIRALFH